MALMFVVSVAGLTACDIESLNKAGAQINLDVNLEEKVDLTVMYPNSGMSNSEFASGRTTKYFEELRQTIKFKKWFFGHYHENKNVTAEEILIYEQIIRIN